MIIEPGIYIDDAGTPGVESPSVFLPESRKSWCAVIVMPKQAHKVSTAMGMFLSGVKDEFGAEELHFSDIYSGRGLWRGVSVQKRVEIFDLMAGVFSAFGFPVFYQTASDDTYKDWPDLNNISRLGGSEFWDLSRPAHLGLLFLVTQVRDELLTAKLSGALGRSEVFGIYVDEGIAKPGAKIEIPLQTKSSIADYLLFDSSLRCAGIQLADFAAFVIARTQWICANITGGKGVSNAEAHILKISEKLNLFNIKRVAVNARTFNKDAWEKVLTDDRRIKGLRVSRNSG